VSIKIAAVFNDCQTISQHFGRTKFYTVLTIENGQIIAREQREKMGHAYFAGEYHEGEEIDPRAHGFAPAAQDRHFRMAEAIRDCQFLLARGTLAPALRSGASAGVGSGAYYNMEQVGIHPMITDIASIDESALEAAQGIIMDHKKTALGDSRMLLPLLLKSSIAALKRK
jgi:hypothetical protein